MSFDALTATIRAYASYLQKKVSKSTSSKVATPTGPDAARSEGSNPHQIEKTYRRLKSSWTRTCMVRELTKVAFYDLEHLRTLLSPIMAGCVLALSTPLHESMFLLEGIWRECWSEMGRMDDSAKSTFEIFFDVLSWMTTSLDFFLWSIPCRPTMDLRLASKELGLSDCG